MERQEHQGQTAENDEWIQTDSGDLILYQGHYMVIYYDRNSYSLTRLGKIINVTQDELKNTWVKGMLRLFFLQNNCLYE